MAVPRFIIRSFLLGIMCFMGCQCAHEPHPVTFGFNAVQCVPVRSVVCVADADYDGFACENDAIRAIWEVNDAVGREVFRFAGVIKPSELDRALDAGTLPILGFDAEHMPPGALAATVPHVELVSNLPCITKVVIVVAPAIAKGRGVVAGRILWRPSYVLAHELVHALGAAHADPHGAFMSRMEPAYGDELQPCFSTADKRTLKAVYGD